MINTKLSIYAITLLLAITTPAFAETSVENEQISDEEIFDKNFNDDYAEDYFSGEDLELTPSELQALKVTQEWKDKTSKTGVVRGPAGSIQFIFGGQPIDIVCAVLQICDIALQQGEQVNTIHIGDAARWKIEPAVTGYGASEIQHIVIKPLDTGLKTNLLVTTDRRTYHINIKSHRTELMPEISFVYPEDAIIKFKAMHAKKTDYIDKNTIPSTNEYLGNLDFEYKIEGDKSIEWIPIRVYNNGTKTIIQLSEKAARNEIPTLLVIDKSSDKEVLVNYRFINNKFIVDSIFKNAILIMDVGSDQQKVTITHLENK